MTTMELTEALQDGIVKAAETYQRLTLDAVSAGMASLDGLLPSRPTMPFTTAFATPKDTIDATFRFAESLMASQKSFLSELATMVEPTK
jgi:hypothetical protein